MKKVLDPTTDNQKNEKRKHKEVDARFYCNPSSPEQTIFADRFSPRLPPV